MGWPRKSSNHPSRANTNGYAGKSRDDAWRDQGALLSPDDMARMIRFAMASGQSPMTTSWLRYLSGGAYIGKRLR